MKNTYPSAIAISEQKINDEEIARLQSIFNLLYISSSIKNISREYIKQNDIKFAIIYNHKRPIEFSINIANDLQSINKVYSIIINNKPTETTTYKFNYIEILERHP